MIHIRTRRTNVEPMPQGPRPRARSIQPKQLRRLHALWHAWVDRLGLAPSADRELRHYYVRLFSQGRASETKKLTESDAAEVIRWLAKLTRPAEGMANYAAGTAGRRGYPERRRIRPNAAAWRALWGCAGALGMERRDLEDFIRRHYAGAGVRGLADLGTMADLNRVLWGLKAMLRRRPREEYSSGAFKKAA
jgi:hypothetical protein